MLQELPQMNIRMRTEDTLLYYKFCAETWNKMCEIVFCTFIIVCLLGVIN